MKMEFQRKDERQLLPEPGKTPREDTAAVMKFYKLPRAFPPAALAEARRISAQAPSDAEIKGSGRLDLRRKFIFTCDPETARDYDDALSLETDRRGNRVLGVHIADVSHYVRLGLRWTARPTAGRRACTSATA